MTSAVLKNRLLQISGGSFREAEWGYKSFADLLANADLSAVAEIDRTTSPTTIRLLSDQVGQVGEPDALGPNQVIRRDIWSAIFDQEAETTWYWDRRNQRPTTSAEDESAPRLPRVDAVMLRTWRAQFVQTLPQAAAESLTILSWMDDGKVGDNFPISVRHAWFAFLKKVVLDLLKSWLADNDLSSETPLIEPRKGGRLDGHSDLRRFILSVVEHMTESELVDLKIPPLAAMRASDRRR